MTFETSQELMFLLKDAYLNIDCMLVTPEVFQFEISLLKEELRNISYISTTLLVFQVEVSLLKVVTSLGYTPLNIFFIVVTLDTFQLAIFPLNAFAL